MKPFGVPAAFRLEVEVDAPVALDPVSMGPIRLVRITGGQVSGQINGRIMPGGTDWQTITDGMINIDAHYLLELQDGARIEVTSRGQRAPDSPGFWAPIWLKTSAAAHAGLNRQQFLGLGYRVNGRVRIDAFALPDVPEQPGT